MPNTTTDFYMTDFTSNTTISSALMNLNFGSFRGNLYPNNPSVGYEVGTSGVYRIGDTSTYWKRVYSQENIYSQVTSTATPSSGFNSIYFKTDNKPYTKNSSGVEVEVGGGRRVINTQGTPQQIDNAAGVVFDIANGLIQFIYVSGDTALSGDISASPQISGGTVGAEVILSIPNTSTSNQIIFDFGAGLVIDSGTATFYTITQGQAIGFIYDGSVWCQSFRKTYL